jgi:hypothetical protein
MSGKPSTLRRSIALLGHISVLSALAACTQPMGAPDFTPPSGAGTGIATPQPARLSSISVILSKDSARVGESVTATAQGRDQYGRQFAPGVVTWSVVPADIATVSAEGTVTGIAQGVATIWASQGGVPPGSAAVSFSR